jgi:aerobic carbon-monoxide dehydrogenase large subunit
MLGTGIWFGPEAALSIAFEREIGAARRRVEDPRLVRGAGQYVDDLRLPGTVDVAFVRSGYAHARVKRVDLEAARQAPGVGAAWSGERLKDTPAPPLMINLPDMRVTPLPPLAHDLVTMIGYPVAAVVAADRYLARDAADLVEVEYEPLPVVTDAERAMEPDAPIIYPQLGTNVAFHLVREGGDVAGAFARADRSLSLRLDHSRVAQVPMEPRAVLASYDREADLLTVWCSTQVPSGTRAGLSVVLGRPEESIRVIAPDVGGAFGAKSALYPDEIAVALLALELGVPVRWVSTRLEDFQMTMHGRDQVDTVGAAFTNDGVITALKTRSVCNFGAITLATSAAPPALTASRPSAPRSSPSTPTHLRTAPIAAPAARRRPSSPSGWPRRWRVPSGWIRSRSAAATSSARTSSPTPRPTARSTTAATTRSR